MFNYTNFNANKTPVKAHFLNLQRLRENSDLVTRIPQILSVVQRGMFGKIRGNCFVEITQQLRTKNQQELVNEW
jgi:hypothetical protein